MATQAGSAIEARVQRILDAEMRKKHTYSALLGVRSGDRRVDFRAAAGYADAQQDVPLRTDSPFFIASITKLFTTSAILALHDRGKLTLDDLINEHLPAALIEGIHVHRGVDYSQQLTIWQLLSQTSGLADYFEGRLPGQQSLQQRITSGEDIGWDLQQVLDAARQLPSRFAPHPKRVHYSDTNFRLLGAIIEAVSGKSLEENYAEFIYEPLGLQQTYSYDFRNPPAEAPAVFYSGPRPLHIPQTMTSFGADGSIVSTLDEMLRFTRAFAGGELFDPGHLRRMTAQWNMLYPPLIYYGGGLMRVKVPRILSPLRALPEVLGHAGANASVAFHSPEWDLTVVGTLHQIDANQRIFQMMLRVLNAVGKG